MTDHHALSDMTRKCVIKTVRCHYLMIDYVYFIFHYGTLQTCVLKNISTQNLQLRFHFSHASQTKKKKKTYAVTRIRQYTATLV